MAQLQRLTALAVARAMLAGPPTVAGLSARMRACLRSKAFWTPSLAERCAAMAGERWRRLTPRTLAALVLPDAGFQLGWATRRRPFVRHLFVGEARAQQRPPLGLDHVVLPQWPHTTALAQWLNVPAAGMARLARCAPWQRTRPLGDQHYRNHLLPKRTGGWRLLEVPHPHLMAVQRKLLDGLLRHLPPHEAACGFTAGRSVVDHAQAHVGQAVVLKFDLQDFFSSVRASRVHALFATLGYSETVARELTALCTVATPEPVLARLRDDGSLTWQQAQRLRSPHLPQGAPTSAALANLCAFRLDLRLEGLAHAFGATYTRYADDLVFSGDTRLQHVWQRLERLVGRAALGEGFALNHRKTRCLLSGHRQTVCHIVVNDHPNLPRPEFDRLKAVLHACVRHGPSTQNREGHLRWQAHLEGRVAWAAQLNAAKAERLKRLLRQIDWSR